MSTDWLNTTDAGLLAFSAQFSAKITATPVPLTFSSATALVYANAQSAYATKLAIAQDPATKGPLATANKNSAKSVLVRLTREYANQVQGAMSVSDSQRTELGLPIRTYLPSPIPVPMKLGMSILSVDGNTVKVRIFNPANPAKRGLPLGVAGAQIMSYIGTTFPAADGPWHLQGLCTRDTVVVAFNGPDAVAGAKVWISGFFVNPRGQSGFAVEPLSTNLQGSQVISA